MLFFTRQKEGFAEFRAEEFCPGRVIEPKGGKRIEYPVFACYAPEITFDADDAEDHGLGHTAFPGDPAQRFTVLRTKLHAGIDALRGHEDGPVLVPGHYLLGRFPHRFEDAFLYVAGRHHGLDIGFVEAFTGHELSNKLLHVVALSVDGEGRRGASNALHSSVTIGRNSIVGLNILFIVATASGAFVWT